MKKFFTLIAVAMMAVGVYAGDTTTPVTYTFNNQASTYVLGDNAEATTYTMDEIVGYSVNYTSTDKSKMQVKLAANQDIFFEYSNSSAKNNVVKSGENYIQCDSKNFVLNIPVKSGDKIQVKFSAKGSAPTVEVYGDEPCIVADDDAATTCSGKTESDAVVFKATATKGGTAKIKETANGMRVYSISINTNVSTAINEVSSTSESTKAVKCLENGQLVIKKGNNRYNAAGSLLK